jgi:hypothetical protein
MSNQVETASDQDDGSSRLILRLIFAGFGMMAIAGGLMWWTFGPSMFVTLVNTAMNCF